jgi:hypothetical protein
MNKKLNRRRFLRNTSIGFPGAGLIGNKALAVAVKDQKNELPGKLVCRTLGKTGIKVPVIGMGILTPVSPALINAALDAGMDGKYQKKYVILCI